MVIPNPSGLMMILISAAIFFTTMLLSSPAVAGEKTGAHDLGFYFPAAAATTMSAGSCNGGSIEECLMNNEGLEVDDIDVGGGGVAATGLPEMDSETNRRMLYYYRRRYISYGALLRDRVPCSKRGYSYYNCRPAARANPYVRGCSAITHCRSF